VSKASSGTLYRGREVVIFFFLLVHVLDTALVRVSPGAYNAVIDAYKNPLMAIGEFALVAAILFHAFNGLRLILVDFLKQGPKIQKALFWTVMVVWVVFVVAFGARHLTLAFTGGN
jgi:succinate dehydrogenase / fumarate reductase cytochrome b subunit